MNSKVYKYCAVPQCRNTSIKAPNKVFVFVPHNKTTRDKWLKLARRDTRGVTSTTHLYFCEDHFDLPNDMENYMEYKLMGMVSKIRMRAGCLPTRFECQPDRRKRTSGTTKRRYILKKQRKTLVEDCLKEFGEGTTTVVKSKRTQEGSLKTVDKSIKVHKTNKLRSEDETEIKSLPNDMENYVELSLMGSTKQICIRPHALPTKFECQSGWSRAAVVAIKEEADYDIDIEEHPVVSRGLGETSSRRNTRRHRDRRPADSSETESCDSDDTREGRGVAVSVKIEPDAHEEEYVVPEGGGGGRRVVNVKSEVDADGENTRVAECRAVSGVGGLVCPAGVQNMHVDVKIERDADDYEGR